MKRKLLIFLAIITMLSAVSCNLAKPKKYQGSFLVLFNTVTEVVAFANSESEFEEFTKLIYDNLKEYHELYDKYNDYDGVNNIKTINDNAGITPVKVDQRIIDMLLYSKDMYERTDGTVNIAMGPVLEIWHDYRTAGIDDPINAMLPP
ncbi:MAG: FAD:protein FMN transferase, partial [Clostridiales bacterium]|nr:FAD:protein FMN transferase [Clostridiales bacterium]